MSLDQAREWMLKIYDEHSFDTGEREFTEPMTISEMKEFIRSDPQNDFRQIAVFDADDQDPDHAWFWWDGNGFEVA